MPESETTNTTAVDMDIGKHIMDTLMDLLEHQTGVRYTYQEIKKTEDKTA